MFFRSSSVASATCAVASKSTRRRWVHAELPFRLLLDDATEFQRLGCFANADTTNTERLSNLRFNGQSIGDDEFVHDDVPLGLFGGLIAEFRRLDHIVSLEGSLA